MERRKFLRGSLVLAGLTLSGCSTELSPKEEEILASLANPVPESEARGITKRVRRKEGLTIIEIIYQPSNPDVAEKNGIPFYAVTGGTLLMINENRPRNGMILLPRFEYFAIINSNLTVLYACGSNQVFSRFRESSLVRVEKGEQLGILKKPAFCPKGWICDTFDTELQTIEESWLFIQILQKPRYLQVLTSANQKDKTE